MTEGEMLKISMEDRYIDLKVIFSQFLTAARVNLTAIDRIKE